ncbi:hypothetical protein ACROYT_G015066 [Oculina patagonica]
MSNFSKQSTEEAREMEEKTKAMYAQETLSGQLKNGSLNSSKGVPGHEECSTYSVWKMMQEAEASMLKEEAHSKPRSKYIPLSKEVVANGKVVHIRGGIKSLNRLAKKKPCQLVNIHTLATVVKIHSCIKNI